MIPDQLDTADLSRHPPVIPCELPDGLQFVYLDDRGRRRTTALEGAGAIDFGQTRSFRQPPAYRRQRNFPGWWWSATTRSHVVYESWLERHHIIEADRDARVTGIAGQPFGLTWPAGRRQALHVPDIFCRTFDGGGAVTDCRAVGNTDGGSGRAVASCPCPGDHAAFADARVDQQVDVAARRRGAAEPGDSRGLFVSIDLSNPGQHPKGLSTQVRRDIW